MYGKETGGGGTWCGVGEGRVAKVKSFGGSTKGGVRSDGGRGRLVGMYEVKSASRGVP